MCFQLEVFVPVTVEHSPPWHKPPSLSSSPVINDALLLALVYASHRSIPEGDNYLQGHFFAVLALYTEVVQAGQHNI